MISASVTATNLPLEYLETLYLPMNSSLGICRIYFLSSMRISGSRLILRMKISPPPHRGMVKVKRAIFTLLFLGLVYKFPALRLFSLVCIFHNWTSPSGRFWHYHRDSDWTCRCCSCCFSCNLSGCATGASQFTQMSPTRRHLIHSSRLLLWGRFSRSNSVCIFGTIGLPAWLWWSPPAGGYRRLKKIFFSTQPWNLWNHLGSLNIAGIGSKAVRGGRSDYRSLFLCVREKFLIKCVDINGNIERKKIIQTKNRRLFPHPQNATLTHQHLIVSANVFHLFRSHCCQSVFSTLCLRQLDVSTMTSPVDLFHICMSHMH